MENKNKWFHKSAKPSSMISIRDFPLTMLKEGSQTSLYSLIGNRHAVIGVDILLPTLFVITVFRFLDNQMHSLPRSFG